VDGAGALALLDGVTDLYVAKGKKTLHFDLVKERPSDDEILALILGRSGTLRAPALRTGSRFVVGFNPDILGETLLG
jgi:arsenate reductase-like glutaredoxin family protein